MKTIIFRKKLAIGLIILFVGAFVVPSMVQATTIYVDDDNTSGPWDGTLEHPYQHIQDGINNASSGDTVYVFNGTYYENVEVEKPISMIGEDKNSTVIDGDWVASPIYVSADSVNISGFRVQHGSGLLAGIFQFGGQYNTYSGNNIINNTVGIHQRYGSNSTISGNYITDNFSYGILCTVFSSDYTISGNTIANNGTGLLIDNAYNYIIINNNFVSGSISIYGDSLSYWNSHTIENNYVNGKPIYYYKNDSNAVTVPSDAGQVILANCSNFIIQNLNIINVDWGIQLGFSSYNNISMNNITDNSDRGVYLYSSSDNSIFGNTITSHDDPFMPGYGIYLRDSSLHNIISENTITDNNVGIRLKH